MFLWLYLTPLLLLIDPHACTAQECAEFVDLDLSHAFIGTSVRVRLLLYTSEKGMCGTLMSHTDPTAHPQFNTSRLTTFLIHGYRPTGSPPRWLPTITELLLARTDMNLIVVDWNNGAATLNYFKAVENTHTVADNLTAFLEKLKENGVSMSSVHMIGISLGAHISGFVGANMNGSIGRITALDPAGPQFTGTLLKDRLDPSDAQFVDVLHTDIDALGFREPLGHVDFYPNAGTDQPGCPKSILSGSSYFKCDHQRSVFLYMESIKRVCEHKAYPCESYRGFLDGLCTSCERFGDAGCPVFGYDVTGWKDVLLKLNQTKTYFTTNPASPFCMTKYRVEVMIWNKAARWGRLTVKLHGADQEAVATIDHAAFEFKRFTGTRLLAQFDKDVKSVMKMSLKFSTGNVLQPKNRLRVLRVRLTPLEGRERPLCRYDVVVEEDREVTFRPLPCQDSNF
ncbi:lipase member H [Takifugu rubripes]|uniref:Lipase, member Ia n=1 Tax=Takifugu rubripes TaxID=31033 RepID=H2V2B0_TAKRU|nr:lipase member H-like [Takifugu rubripes]XP_011609902.1 lipase member H-like [Takifugu rubripes]|eukprot:XP_003971326.1 PREDICTED: lipase member H-like [Takifugu rubripes]